MPALMTTQQVAELLGVTSVCVTKYVKAGLLPVFMRTRPFLFDGVEVAKFKKEVWPLLTPGRPWTPRRYIVGH